MEFWKAIKSRKEREKEKFFRLFRLKYDKVLAQLVFSVRMINNKKEKERNRISPPNEERNRISPPNGTSFTNCDVTALIGNDYTFLCKFTYVSDNKENLWITEFTTSVLYSRGTIESCKNTFLGIIPKCYHISPDLVNLEIDYIRFK